MTNTTSASKRQPADREPEIAEHPEVEDLVKYYRDELSPEQRAEVHDHLVLCRTCTVLYLSLVSPSSLDEEDGERLKKAWERFQAALQH